MSAFPPVELLLTIAEPTRLRILNCLAAAPLFVSDLQAVLDLPQPTVSRHLQVLRRAEVVRDTPIAQFVLYRLRRDAGPLGAPPWGRWGRGWHSTPGRGAQTAPARGGPAGPTPGPGGKTPPAKSR